MYRLLLMAILFDAATKLKLNWAELSDCRSKECLHKIEKASRKILNVEWKPISVFPEESKRFR